MLKTNRYEGLLFLKKSGLPVPELIKIDSLNDIKYLSINDDVRHGWTLRTCKRNGLDEYGLFFQNNMDSKSVIKCLIRRLLENDDEYYIVYPSWDMLASYNILAENGKYVIEGGKGSQKGITMAKEIAQYSVVENIIKEEPYENNPDYNNQEVNKHINIILEFLRRSIKRDIYYVEVAFTKSGEIYFYEYHDI